MAQSQSIDKPKRWDLPFSRDLPNALERHDMSEEDVERLLSLEPFSRMDRESFPKNLPLRDLLKNDTRIRHYRDGDVIVRQGDYGNSAFLILDGSVQIILEGLDQALVRRSDRQRKSWIRSIAKLITNPRSPEVRDTRRYPQMQKKQELPIQEGERVFVQDVTNVLSVFPDVAKKTKNVVMHEGQLFGELAALGRIPRAATVLATSHRGATVLEIRWQGLRDLRKYDDALREHTDKLFRNFGLASTLSASPLLAHLDEEDMQKVTQSAQFATYGSFDWYGTFQELRRKEADPLSKEPIIAEAGHYPNGLVLIRAGFARLSHRHGNGERTFSYLGKGDVYGLAELAYNAQHNQQIPLTATLRAVGYVDVVRIPTRTFEQLILPRIPMEMVPKLPPEVVASQQGEREEKPATQEPPPQITPLGSDDPKINPAMMEFLVENRFINGTATMMIDLDRCTRCDDCVRACASGHDNNPRFIRHGAIFGHHMVANACMHCADPVCMIGCPTGAIHRNEEHGEVIINDITCIGCGTCAASCPYDNIRMVEVRDVSNNDAVVIDPIQGKPIAKATKCDLCVDHHGGPACERACPHDALKRVDMHDLKTLSQWINR